MDGYWLRLCVLLSVCVFVRLQVTTQLNAYTALVPVNIRCVNDPTTGLTCAAEYPDHCKEQWNFPNPCTPENIAINITKFVHPFDTTKFLMCGDMGKLYVVQCPQYEVFHEGCGQCVGESAGLTASCEIPLTRTVLNPCTREAIIANKLFFPFPGNITKFIHCDIWGKAWERICTPGEVWSQWDVSCVNPALLNPCNRPTTDVTYLYRHPCNPFKYLKCDNNGKAYEVMCDVDTAFNEGNQRCDPTTTFHAGTLEDICGNHLFSFRFNVLQDMKINNGIPTLQGGGLQLPFVSPGLAQSSSASSVNPTMETHRLNAILAAWRDNITSTATGNSRTAGTSGSQNSASTGIAVDGQIVTAAMDIHPSQLREYSFSDIPYSEPCTADNLAQGRSHFRLKGDPHSFLQCDNAGKMYKMPCSTNSRDWFDVYTMTCVDGPVHVDYHIKG